ncbi:MAG: hypothetical protein HQ548_06820, partial [Chloroflexi bacterium]|nr:hypothetical protein [Chloroflexota bacterium]
HFEKMLQDYYGMMGWDEGGRPLRETLDGLGLENVTVDLWPERT